MNNAKIWVILAQILDTIPIGTCKFYEVIDRGIYLCRVKKKDKYGESGRTDCCGKLVKCEITQENLGEIELK